MRSPRRGQVRYVALVVEGSKLTADTSTLLLRAE